MEIVKSEQFNKWYKKLDLTQKTLIDVRLTRILINHHFGEYRNLGSVLELKFRMGLRIYFGKDGDKIIILLCGGGKNSKKEQSRDIEQANKIWEEYQNGK